MEQILRKFYNEIVSNSKVGEHKELLNLIGTEIDKLQKNNNMYLSRNPKNGSWIYRYYLSKMN